MTEEIETYELRLATGGRPLERVMEAFLALPGNGRGWMVDIEHDAGCPTIGSDILERCSCEIIRLTAHTVKRAVWRTTKVPERYQPRESSNPPGWKPPRLDG